jgi:NTE family protein
MEGTGGGRAPGGTLASLKEAIGMLAVVLSGGGNYGAMQAGALEVMAERGIRPELVVGTSAGALNAIHYAANPSPEGARRLQDVWRQVTQGMVGSLSLLGGLQRLVTNHPSLFSNKALAEFVEGHLPDGVSRFGELRRLAGVRAFTLAACLDTGEPAVFGDRDDDRLLDGAMASTGLPPYLPPWEVDGRRYIDGAVFSNLPIRTAVERGATQVVAIEIHHAVASLRASRFMIDITTSAVSLMVEHMAAAEVRWASRHRIPVHHIQLKAPENVPFWDYAESDILIDSGRRLMQTALEREPIEPMPEWKVRLRRAVSQWLPGRD